MTKFGDKIHKIIKPFRDKRLTTVAGSWVFFFLLAVVPLTFLLITAFGVFGVDISLSAIDNLPEEFRVAGRALVETATNASKGITVFFAITVMLSCSSLLNQMSKDGDSIYGVRSVKKRGILRRLWAIIAIAVLFLIFLGTALFVAFGTVILQKLSQNEANKILATILIFCLVISFTYAIIILLNKFICPVKLKLSTAAIGGLVSLGVIVLGTIGFIIYLRSFSNYNAFYGSLATVVVFLLWTYIIMLGLVLGTIINMQIVKKEKRNATNKRLD